MNNKLSFQIDSVHAGERIDSFLATQLADLTRSQIQKAIDAGLVTLNGAVVRKRAVLKARDTIEVGLEQIAARAHPVLQPEPMELSVIFEDECLLAIDKPAGLVVHPGNGNHSGTLVHGLLARMPALAQQFDSDRPGIVHRLDKETSGILLVAKSLAVHATLAQQFADRVVSKHYLGICVGERPDDEGVINAPLARDRHEPVKRAVRAGGKIAETIYRLQGFHCGIAVVGFYPKTGRTHQIRVHSAHAGFPIIADTLYGDSQDALKRLQPLDRPFASAVSKCFKRHALHAFSIEFDHPISGQRMKLQAPLPPDMHAAMHHFEHAGITLHAGES
jgi:23S rRNA pseudouridine1911/1915/1917 synthase